MGRRRHPHRHGAWRLLKQSHRCSTLQTVVSGRLPDYLHALSFDAHALPYEHAPCAPTRTAPWCLSHGHRRTEFDLLVRYKEGAHTTQARTSTR
eukprot:1315903-Pleurochrysis_carterae.AAC.1